MKLSLIGAIAMLALWIALAFVLAVPSGLVHIPLAVAAILAARVIVLGSPEAGREDHPSGD